MQLTADPLLLELDDPDVIAWRYERFTELGFSRVEAESLAYSAIDWHRLAELTLAGCPLRLAVEILA
jgi:hypothetical protein